MRLIKQLFTSVDNDNDIGQELKLIHFRKTQDIKIIITKEAEEFKNNPWEFGVKVEVINPLN